jgi:hypothetical protein
MQSGSDQKVFIEACDLRASITDGDARRIIVWNIEKERPFDEASVVGERKRKEKDL